MPLWKITEKSPSKAKETKFKQEKLLEEHLEDWTAVDSMKLKDFYEAPSLDPNY